MKDNTLRLNYAPVSGQQFNEANVLKCIYRTIGAPGVADCDYNFASAANTTEQPIDLGACVPALARVTDVIITTEETFTGATSLGVTCGNATGGTQYFTTANLVTADAINSIATGAQNKVAPSASAAHVWVNATPGANWSLVTAGKLGVYVYYNDPTGLR